MTLCAQLIVLKVSIVNFNWRDNKSRPNMTEMRPRSNRLFPKLTKAESTTSTSTEVSSLTPGHGTPRHGTPRAHSAETITALRASELIALGSELTVALETELRTSGWSAKVTLTAKWATEIPLLWTSKIPLLWTPKLIWVSEGIESIHCTCAVVLVESSYISAEHISKVTQVSDCANITQHSHQAIEKVVALSYPRCARASTRSTLAGHVTSTVSVRPATRNTVTLKYSCAKEVILAVNVSQGSQSHWPEGTMGVLAPVSWPVPLNVDCTPALLFISEPLVDTVNESMVKPEDGVVCSRLNLTHVAANVDMDVVVDFFYVGRDMAVRE